MADTRFVNIGSPLEIKCTRLFFGVGVPDLHTISPYILLTIQRTSDSLYWTGITWGTLTALAMPPVDNTNSPGEYYYSGPTPTVADTYNCHAYFASGKYAFDSYETLVAQYNESVLAASQPNIASTGIALTGAIKSEVWDSTMEYVDETGETFSAKAWIMLQGIFSNIKQRLKQKE